MVTALLFDFSRVFLFAKDRNYNGELNALHKSLSAKPGYKFFEHFMFNEELFNIVEQLKYKTDIFMFTSGIIQEAPEVQAKINGLFKEVFSANKLGLPKNDPNTYFDLVGRIGKPQEEIVFIDDSSKNILAAQEANLSTILYTGNLQLVNDLKHYLNFTI